MVARPTRLVTAGYRHGPLSGELLLIVFGIRGHRLAAVLAAVAVNALIAWHHHSRRSCRTWWWHSHAHGAGSLIWKLLVGVAYIFIGGYLLLHPCLGVASS